MGLVLGLLLFPVPASAAFWNVAVPLLPLLFIVNVELWRNVCPLATLNAVAGEGNVARTLSKDAIHLATIAGISTLLVSIPARRLVLNDDGVATGVVLAAFAVMALASGFRFQNKAGFCNSVCPILPVERLYGTRPLAVVENARCTPCRACTRSGCIDLGTERSVLQVLGEARNTRAWVLTPFALFALSFPGVITGFYLVPGLPADSAFGVYATIALFGGVSWAGLAAVFTLGRPAPPNALFWTAGLSASLYYWFTPAAISEAFGLPPLAAPLMRGVAFALIALWVLRAARHRGAQPLTLGPRAS